MMNNRKRLYRIIAWLMIGLVVTVFVASLALARRDASVYPSNLYAGPIYLGSLTRAEALHKLQEDSVTESMELTCIIGQDSYSLKLIDLGIRLDSVATIKKIETIVADWSLLSHSIYRGKKQVVAPVWMYDDDKLRQSIHNRTLSMKKEAVDARIVLHGEQLFYYPEQQGTQIDAELAVKFTTELLNDGQFKVIWPETTIAPRITRQQISSITELLSVQAVPASSEYPVTQITGWAEAGKVILPGQSVSISIDAYGENGLTQAIQWQETLSMVASEAGLTYEAVDQQLHNPYEDAVALFINQIPENDLWLIRIYGQPRDDSKKVAISNTYTPLVTSATASDDREIKPSLYRHEFVDNKLRDTKLLGEVVPTDPPSTVYTSDKNSTQNK
jgi:vancomycin resistance protein YoaR